jgi:hypothetical protein
MLISNSNKTILYFNPKTGGTSIYNTYKDSGLDVCYHDIRHSVLTEETDYALFCFYRNPIEKFVSAYNHMCLFELNSDGGFKGYYNNPILLFMYEKFHNVSVPEADAVNVIAQGITWNNHQYRLSITDFITVLTQLRDDPKEKAFANLRVFHNQTHWLDHPNLTLLDFRDINNEVRKATDALGISYKELRRDNVSVKHVNVADLTPEEISAIKAYYATDYAFFASKNITFD